MAVHDHDNLGGSNRWLSLREVAEILDVPYSSVAQYHRKWGLPSVKFGRAVKIRERSLDAWIAKKETEAVA